MKLSDLVGVQFSTLTVVSYAGASKWNCTCSCGHSCIVRTSDLLSNPERKGCRKCFSRTKESGLVGFLRLWDKYRRRAKDKNREFNLSQEDFRAITSSNCFYCGISPMHKATSTHRVSELNRLHATYNYNGIDRKDSSIGYTYANSIPCCEICNKAKRDMSFEAFIEYLNRLVAYRLKL